MKKTAGPGSSIKEKLYQFVIALHKNWKNSLFSNGFLKPELPSYQEYIKIFQERKTKNWYPIWT
jgi:hypothetical protein